MTPICALVTGGVRATVRNFGLAFLCLTAEAAMVAARSVAFIGDENARCAPAFL